MRALMNKFLGVMILFPFICATGAVQAEDQDSGALPVDEFENEAQQAVVSDPLEPLNRAVFWFNDKAYFYVMKPVARGLRVIPSPVRNSVSNAFHNLATPIRLINASLQLKLRDSGTELGRFVINSTIGVLGLFDPAASHFNLKPKEEDFGQTLGHYGVGPGAYIVIPLLGPSNLRDTAGSFADVFIDPIYYMTNKHTQDYIVAKAAETVNALSIDKDTYEAVKRDSLDPYAFIRSAYAQRRATKINE